MSAQSPTPSPWFAAPPAAWIEVSGPDAANFLQGQFSNDLRGDPGSAVYGLWLDHRGRILGDSWVLRRAPDQFAVISYATPAAAIRTTLEAHIIADDVTLLDRGGAGILLSVWGAAAAVAPGAFHADAGALAWRGRRDTETVVEWLAPAADLALWRQRLGLPDALRLAPEELARRRITAGIPLIPRDAGAEFTPLDAGLEDAVSFAKGCFLGQEVVARMQRMERAAWKLVRLRGAGPAPPTPQAVHAGGVEVGSLSSAAAEGDGWIGLAMLKRKLVATEAAPALHLPGAAAMANVC
jgi:hypothetical protein